jgi:hypothetical protein
MRMVGPQRDYFAKKLAAGLELALIKIRLPKQKKCVDISRFPLKHSLIASYRARDVAAFFQAVGLFEKRGSAH